MAPPPLSLKGRALRCLAGREHSRAELLRKLAPYEEAPGQLERVLDELQAKGFISEERVAASLLHRRAARLGDRRIRQELQAKGLDAPTVAQALEQLRGTERERAQGVWQRKFGAPPQDAKEHARQVRFLLARGFSAEVVRRVVQGGEGEDAQTGI
ncbi:recombination regulator RecX [Simplicispira lacusdiani]|uniref:recombination regulator RecX n=1 Tax=Simplicispira lacusdiani TaxID=2213010 RepID=UPI000E75EA7E|nr:recombination regulator RecX [Simplicispira lacusdiani]